MNGIARFFRESMVARFFIPLGVILIIFSVFLFISNNKTKDYPKVEGVVSRIEPYEAEYIDSNGDKVEATYRVFMKYTVNGTEYDEEYGIFSNYKVGDKKTIVYNPSNPKEISDPPSLLFALAFLIGGIASLVGGIISTVKSLKKYKAMKLQEEGWKKDGK